MSDQHVVTDWKAYFASLGPGTPSPFSRDFGAMYEGPTACFATFVLPSGDLESKDTPEGVSFLDWCLDLWVTEGKPEMWCFINRAGPPWHVPAQPKAQPQKGRRA